MKRLVVFAAVSLAVCQTVSGERINQEGRILGPLPVVTNSILFNTNRADAVVSAMQIFPVTNPWNEDISHRPLLPNSDAMIAQIISDLAAANRKLIAFFEMNYVLVPDDQPLVPILFFNYPDESDLNGGVYPGGLYPIPTNLPIESWPRETGTLTLSQWQRAANSSDRHAIIVQPGNGFSRETWLTRLSGANWEASNGAQFDLNSNAARPAGWTSGDAAGLPMFPALPRYDECQRGMVEHACRIVVKQSRREYIYPATHYASSTPATETNVPAMGQRVRLKSSFVIPDHWLKEEKAVLLALKKYGAIVADNGSFFSISVTPDDRWPPNCFDHFTSIAITNFEVVQTTGPDEGPRSPGAPAADAGLDQLAPLTQPAQLRGFVTYAGAPPAIHWNLYSGPGLVTFGDAAQTNTTASFSAPGVYTLMLSADDGIHSVAYDAVVITVTAGCPAIIVGPATLPAVIVGTPYDQTLSASGGTAPHTFAVTSGDLPLGLTVSIDGNLSGTPAAAGNFSFTLTATDSYGCAGSQSYDLAANCPTITLSPTTPPTAEVGTAYEQTNSASGGTAPYLFAVTGGSLPPDLTISSNGILSGVPANFGAYNFTVTATDTYGCSGTQSYTLAVGAPIITVQPLSQAVPTGSNVTLTVVAVGTPAPVYQWFFNSASIPDAVETTLTITDFQSFNEGNYSVVVSNEVGSLASEIAGVYLAGPLRFVNSRVDAGNGFRTWLVGPGGTNFTIDGSTNLPDWTPLTTGSAPFGVVNFTDTNRISFTNELGVRSYRFYRAWLSP